MTEDYSNREEWPDDELLHAYGQAAHKYESAWDREDIKQAEKVLPVYDDMDTEILRRMGQCKLAERVMNTSHHDGLGMGWQELEEIIVQYCKEQCRND